VWYVTGGYVVSLLQAIEQLQISSTISQDTGHSITRPHLLIWESNSQFRNVGCGVDVQQADVQQQTERTHDAATLQGS
jgi:hypothetical protein